jgi:hypothetical protein
MRKVSIYTAGAILSAALSFSAMAEMPNLPRNMSTATQEEVSSALSELGFNELRDARLNGNVYTADGVYQGRHVKLWIDTESGRIIDQNTSDLTIVATKPDMTAAEMKSALEDRGFQNVRDMTKAGSIFLATAEWNGQTEQVRVDSATGIVTTEEDRTQSREGIDRTNPVTDREPIRGR